MGATPMGWRVTAQQHTETYTPGGQFETGVRVSFVTKNGTHGQIFVPDAQYTAENVTDRINEFAEREDAVASLGN